MYQIKGGFANPLPLLLSGLTFFSHWITTFHLRQSDTLGSNVSLANVLAGSVVCAWASPAASHQRDAADASMTRRSVDEGIVLWLFTSCLWNGDHHPSIQAQRNGDTMTQWCVCVPKKKTTSKSDGKLFYFKWPTTFICQTQFLLCAATLHVPRCLETSRKSHMQVLISMRCPWPTYLKKTQKKQRPFFCPGKKTGLMLSGCSGWRRFWRPSQG